jgi:hypothetical protein
MVAAFKLESLAGIVGIRTIPDGAALKTLSNLASFGQNG